MDRSRGSSNATLEATYAAYTSHSRPRGGEHHSDGYARGMHRARNHGDRSEHESHGHGRDGSRDAARDSYYHDPHGGSHHHRDHRSSHRGSSSRHSHEHSQSHGDGRRSDNGGHHSSAPRSDENHRSRSTLTTSASGAALVLPPQGSSDDVKSSHTRYPSDPRQRATPNSLTPSPTQTKGAAAAAAAGSRTQVTDTLGGGPRNAAAVQQALAVAAQAVPATRPLFANPMMMQPAQLQQAITHAGLLQQQPALPGPQYFADLQKTHDLTDEQVELCRQRMYQQQMVNCAQQMQWASALQQQQQQQLQKTTAHAGLLQQQPALPIFPGPQYFADLQKKHGLTDEQVELCKQWIRQQMINSQTQWSSVVQPQQLQFQQPQQLQFQQPQQSQFQQPQQLQFQQPQQLQFQQPQQLQLQQPQQLQFQQLLSLQQEQQQLQQQRQQQQQQYLQQLLVQQEGKQQQHQPEVKTHPRTETGGTGKEIAMIIAPKKKRKRHGSGTSSMAMQRRADKEAESRKDSGVRPSGRQPGAIFKNKADTVRHDSFGIKALEESESSVDSEDERREHAQRWSMAASGRKGNGSKGGGRGVSIVELETGKEAYEHRRRLTERQNTKRPRYDGPGIGQQRRGGFGPPGGGASSNRGGSRRGGNDHVRASQNPPTPKRSTGAVVGPVGVEEMKRRDERSRRFVKQLQETNAVAAAAAAASAAAQKSKTMKPGTLVGTCVNLEKPYLRLTRAADSDAVRSPQVLEKAFDRLVGLWEEKKMAEYKHVSEQFKSIRQDLKVQHIKDSFALQVYETNARIALVAGDLSDFNQCQGQVFSLFDDVRAKEKGWRKNYIEFVSYKIMYFVKHQMPLASFLRGLSKETLAHDAVKFGLKVRTWVQDINFVAFFKNCKSAPYHGRHLMATFVPYMRFEALKRLSASYKDIPLSKVSPLMGFDSKTDFFYAELQAYAKARNGEVISGRNQKGKMEKFLKSGCAIEPLAPESVEAAGANGVVHGNTGLVEG